MQRSTELRKLSEHGDGLWDVAIIGGGATGLGIAVDAASRGLKTILFERGDFAKGTSSKSTKLVHGGVRYLAQGNISLVYEALRERDLLFRNAPHLVHDLHFVIPTYSWFRKLFYGFGMRVYDLLAMAHALPRSRMLSKAKTLAALPNVIANELRGGVLYHDGQFDDARLAINLAQTASEQGACVLNYMEVKGLEKDHSGRITGVFYRDIETGIEECLSARCVINATGISVDDVLKMEHPSTAHLVAPSQGSHIVVDQVFMPSKSALMIPKTSDNRVLFLIPWHNRTVIGTTDIPVEHSIEEPRPLKSEIEFILNTANQYLDRKISYSDIRSVFAGQRPLAAPKADGATATKEISRGHKVMQSKGGLITIVGGKWTTYRWMAEDVLNKAQNLLGKLPPCKTRTLKIHGSDQAALDKLIAADQSLAQHIHPRLPITFAQIVWAFRQEMAVTVEDALARRTRAVFLDAEAAIEVCDTVAAIAARELKRDQLWQMDQSRKFRAFAEGYCYRG
jgi:glycerol-3-phosphate dehydrogenase